MKLLMMGAALALMAAQAMADHHAAGEDEAAAMSEDEMMQAMQAAAAPGEAHARLADGVGAWSARMEAYMEPGGEPMVAEMTVAREMDLDGRVLVERWKGVVMDQPFEGIARTGYDNVSKRYWSTWTDNMSTGVLVMYGDWDEASESFVFEGKSVHPVTGAPYRTRTVGKHPAPGVETMDMYEDHGEGEYKSMSIAMKRD